MAYKKTEWKDTLRDASGKVIQKGTPLNADALVKIEDGIVAAEQKIDTEITKVTQQLAQKANQTALEVERARINSLTTLPTGSTTGDAELVDARVGADGITYQNVGNAVRVQVNGLKNNLSEIFNEGINTQQYVWEQGDISSVSDNNSITTRIKTAKGVFYTSTKEIYYVLPSGLRLMIWYYDTNGTYVKRSDWITTNGKFTLEPFEQYRICIASIADASNILPSVGKTVRFYTQSHTYYEMQNIKTYVNEANKELFVKGAPIQLSWEQGTINTKDSPDSNTSLIRIKTPSTIFYDIADVLDIHAENNYYAMVFYYDSDKRYISNTSWTTGRFKLTSPNNAKYFRVCMNYNKDVRNIVPAEGNNVKVYIQKPIEYTYTDYVIPYVEKMEGSRADFKFDSTTRWQDVIDWCDLLRMSFSARGKRIQYGTSSVPTGEYRNVDSTEYPLYAYEFKFNPSASRKIIIMGGIHGPGTGGDKIHGVVASAYFMRDLLFNPNRDVYFDFIKNNCTIVYIPVLNPWGYQNGYRSNGRGIDLNRNFDFNFVANGVSYGYGTGATPFSENETSSLRDFLTTNHSDADFACEIHTRGNDVIPSDARWFAICNHVSSGMLTSITEVVNLMSKKYGGTASVDTSNTNVPNCFNYISNVIGIPCYEPEFAPVIGSETKSTNSQALALQNVDFMAIQIKKLIDVLILGKQ